MYATILTLTPYLTCYLVYVVVWVRRILESYLASSGMSRVHPKAWGRGQLASDVTTGSTTLMWMSRLDRMRWAAPFLPPWRFLSTIPPLMRPGLVNDTRILLLLDFSHKIDRYPGKILCTVLEKKLQKCSLSFGLKYPWVNRACVFFFIFSTSSYSDHTWIGGQHHLHLHCRSFPLHAFQAEANHFEALQRWPVGTKIANFKWIFVSRIWLELTG